MGEAEAVPSGAGTSSWASVSDARRLLTVGAAPTTDWTLDEGYARHRCRRVGLRKARALLELGPAGAVDDVEALYEIGLPHGLPGGLSSLAIAEREAESHGGQGAAGLLPLMLPSPPSLATAALSTAVARRRLPPLPPRRRRRRPRPSNAQAWPGPGASLSASLAATIATARSHRPSHR